MEKKAKEDFEGMELAPPAASASPQIGFRSGFVALVGCPNVGKSTLLNRLVGKKIAIVSDKPQTTRNRILGVRTDAGSQMVFLDTPGLHQPREDMNKFMVDQALGSLADADVAVFILDGNRGVGKGDAYVLERVLEAGVPWIAALNKIDQLKPDALSKVWEVFTAFTPGALDHIAISALHGAGIEALAALLKAQMQEGPMFYPQDSVTDQNLNFQLAELIRERVYVQTREEIPYATAVIIETVEDKGPEQAMVISARIVVENPSQKGIMIGKKGEMLKKIGAGARKSMEELLNRRVYLDLRVEVHKRWRNDPREMRKFGYAV
jgi:GTP-binding protein Era